MFSLMNSIVCTLIVLESFNRVGVCGTKVIQQNVLCTSDSGENFELSTSVGCEDEPAHYIVQSQSRNGMESVDTLLRAKREEPKTNINLPPGYSVYRIPKLPDQSPMPVFLFINISKILDWNEFNEAITVERGRKKFGNELQVFINLQNIEVDMEFRVMWTDFKILGFNNKSHPGNGIPVIDTLSPDEIKATRKTDNNPGILNSIWKPNLFMVGLLSVSQPLLMSKPLTIRFIPELGWFEYITRLQVKLDCPMNYQYYPADTQSCSVAVRGFSYTNVDLNLTWYKKGVYLSKLDTQNFVARIDEPTHFEIVRSDDEVYDALGFTIVARRKLSYHLVQTFLASSIYCIITTLSLLVPSSMVEARIGMLMTTLLTLTAMFGSIRSSTPTVSYTKAIDIWMIGCIFFVFLALSQYAFCVWLKYVKIAEKSPTDISKWAFKMDSANSWAQRSARIDPRLMNPATKAEKILTFYESYSFAIFLSSFSIYSTGYWIWLLTASDYFYWNVNTTWNNV